jgi:hypothetical protein
MTPALSIPRTMPGSRGERDLQERYGPCRAAFPAGSAGACHATRSLARNPDTKFGAARPPGIFEPG